MSQNKKPRFPFDRRKKEPQKPKLNYAFIDAQNLNLGVQRVGWKMDRKKFRAYLKESYNVEKAFMFIGYVPENENLYKQMQEAGYIVVLKPTVDMLMSEEELKDEKHVTKGNADAELVLYAMKELKNYNKAIIVSGDGDFYCLIEYLKEQGKLARLLAPNSHYSSLYKPYESFIHTLDKEKQRLAYTFINKRKHKTKK